MLFFFLFFFSFSFLTCFLLEFTLTCTLVHVCLVCVQRCTSARGRHFRCFPVDSSLKNSATACPFLDDCPYRMSEKLASKEKEKDSDTRRRENKKEEKIKICLRACNIDLTIKLRERTLRSGRFSTRI